MAEKAIVSSPKQVYSAILDAREHLRYLHEAGTQDREEKLQVTHTTLEGQLEDRPSEPELKHTLWHLTAALFLSHRQQAKSSF